MNNIVPPQFQKDAFTCPFCNVHAKFSWADLFILNDKQPQWTRRKESRCHCCNDACIWDYDSKQLIYPLDSVTHHPHPDMPDDIKVDFEEAASIFQYSPRAAAALLRLALQKLCKELGGKGKDINKDIRYFSEHDILPKTYIRMADTVRLTGNEAVHPGTMKDEDVDFVADKLFLFLNNIVIKGITEPKEAKEFYNMTPVLKRQYAEEADARAKAK